MLDLNAMAMEISRLYNEESYSYIDAREIVIRSNDIKFEDRPNLRSYFGSIFGQRGGRKNKGKNKKKVQKPSPLFSSSQLKIMVAQSLAVMRMRRDHLLSDP